MKTSCNSSNNNKEMLKKYFRINGKFDKFPFCPTISNDDQLAIKSILDNIAQNKRINYSNELNRLILGGKGLPCDETTCKNYQIYIYDLIKNHYDLENLTQNHKNMMFANKYFYFVTKKVINTIQLTDKLFCVAIINNNIDLVVLLNEKHDFRFKTTHLELACQYSKLDMRNLILQYKIIPTQKCFDIVVSRYKYICGNKNKSKSKSKSKFGSGEQLDDILELKILRDGGFDIKQSDFVKLMGSGVYIYNYNALGLKIDDAVQNACNGILCFPYPETKFNKDNFPRLFDFNFSLRSIKNIAEEYDCEYTLECLGKACQHKKLNRRIIRYLTDEKNIKPDVECLLNVVQNCGNNLSIIKHIYKKINKDDQQNIDDVDLDPDGDYGYDDLKKYLLCNYRDDLEKEQ